MAFPLFALLVMCPEAQNTHRRFRSKSEIPWTAGYVQDTYNPSQVRSGTQGFDHAMFR